MKKLALAIAAITACGVSHAATVYDKDGTTFAVGGRVQSVVYNGNTSKLADQDNSLRNTARLNVSGNTKVFDWLSVYAFSEWNMADGNKSGTGDNINTREQYVGANFGRYGKLTLGKTYDSLRSALSPTYVTDDFGGNAQPNHLDRRTGQVKYEYNGYGLNFQLSYQTAEDSIDVVSTDRSLNKKANVRGGFSTSIGYTFDDVLFGPLSIKAGYSYLDGQKVGDTIKAENRFENYKTGGASISWGTLSSGLYMAAMTDFGVEKVTEQNNPAKPGKTIAGHTQKFKGYEFVVGYKFDNGIGTYVGYNYLNTFNTGTEEKIIYRRVPAYITYSLNPHFLMWSEMEFDADSSDNARDNKYEAGTSFSVGARYIF